MTRRELLTTMGAGFGMVGLQGLQGAEVALDPHEAESAALSGEG